MVEEIIDDGLCDEFFYFNKLKICIQEKLPKYNTIKMEALYFNKDNVGDVNCANDAAKKLIPVYEKIIRINKDKFSEEELSDLLN